jgi:hypothetical protein
MQRNSFKRVRKLYLEMLSKSRSWSPIARNGWAIKFSTVGDDILLIFFSQYTSQTIIRHFNNEEDAILFINYMLTLDSTIITNFA